MNTHTTPESDTARDHFVAAYVQSICDAVEQYIEHSDKDAPARIAQYEAQLHSLGLTQADIYSFVYWCDRSSDAK